jgi:hypothetical protein
MQLRQQVDVVLVGGDGGRLGKGRPVKLFHLLPPVRRQGLAGVPAKRVQEIGMAQLDRTNAVSPAAKVKPLGPHTELPGSKPFPGLQLLRLQLRVQVRVLRESGGGRHQKASMPRDLFEQAEEPQRSLRAADRRHLDALESFLL